MFGTKFLLRIDWKLVLPVIVLLVFSLTTIFSINTSLFINQLAFIILSSVVFLFLSQIELESIEIFSLPIYIVSIILLIIVLLIGLESRGAVRWIDLFGFRIQFSEVLKPFLLISFATLLVRRQNKSIKTLGVVSLYLLPILLLIYRQPDLGNAIIYASTVIITLLLYGFPARWFAIGAGIMAIVIPFVFRFLHPYQQQRILTFFHLSNDPLGTSYNAIQSIIAVGSGSFFGKGLGLGTQSALHFLPERHTDFLFATLTEDLGFIGSIIVVGFFALLLYRCFIIFSQGDNRFEKIFVAGAFSLFLIQFFVNVGMNIGLLPIVGVTLPFMSYGGSSLLANAILLGLLSSIGSLQKKKNVMEIK